MSNEQQAGGFDAAILEKLGQLQEKYAAMGQDLSSYLDGLLYACLLYTSPSPRD